MFEHFQGPTAYHSPPFLRRKTPPTRFRLLQNLQNLYFTMCLSTFRGWRGSCTLHFFERNGTRVDFHFKESWFWAPSKSALQGGTLAEAEKGHSLITFLIKNAGANHACQNPEFHAVSGSVHPMPFWVFKIMIFLKISIPSVKASTAKWILQTYDVCRCWDLGRVGVLRHTASRCKVNAAKIN